MKNNTNDTAMENTKKYVAVVTGCGVREDSYEHGEVDCSDWEHHREVSCNGREDLLSALNDIFKPIDTPVIEHMGETGKYTYSWLSADWEGVQKLPDNYRAEYRNGARNIYQQTVFLTLYERAAVDF